MASSLTGNLRLKIVSVLIVAVVLFGGFGVQQAGNQPQPDHEIVSGDANLFPTFVESRYSYVVTVPPNTDLGTMLTLTSLQGLVNRHSSRIFLDIEGPGNTSFLLPFIEARYGINFTRIDITTFIQTFSSYADGLVVYDPDRIETTDLATVVAGLNDYIIVGPDSADEVTLLTGRSVELNLNLPPWEGMSAVQMFRRSFSEYYPRCTKTLLSILPPGKTGLRDYLIAAKVWTFHVSQGPFASQDEIDFTDDVLAATPHNIPVLGWFQAPTITEENFFVQHASRYGKYIMGGQDVPNISFLAGLTPPQSFKQKRIVQATPSLADDGIYVSFAVPDGDNLDFTAGRMLEMWGDDVRGSVPIAWTVNPLLATLAPPLLDYYYFQASVSDSFVAGPSGAGYLYPGFAPQADLKEYLVRARNSMAQADLDVVWLLNSFAAYETPYDQQTLESYATSLAPRGMILDYADQAVTHDAWIQGGEGTAAPVIRATHLWSGRDNLVGKVMVDVDASPSKPHFFLVVVYPWSLSLGEAVKAADSLRSRYGSRVNIVGVEELFSLVGKGFVKDATEATARALAEPFAALDPWDLDAAREMLRQAQSYESSGDMTMAGFRAGLALEHARRALAVGMIVFLAIVAVLVLVGVFVVWRARQRNGGNRLRDPGRWLLPGAGSAALFYLFFAGLQKALDYYFWTYGSVFMAGAVIVFAPRLQSRIESAVGGNIWPLETGVLGVSGIFLFWEPWAFVPFACASAMLLYRFLGHDKSGRDKDAVFLGLGIGGSVFIPFSWASLAFFVSMAVGLAYVLRPQSPPRAESREKAKTPGVTFAATVLALVTIWFALYQNRYFVEKAGGGLDLLRGLAAVTMVVAPVLALATWNVLRPRWRLDALLILCASAVLWAVVWLVQDIALFTFFSLVLAVTICWSSLSASARVNWNGLAVTRYTSRLLVLGMIVVVLVRMPAIVYSLYTVKLPFAAEYVLYTPPLLMIFATIDIVQTEALWRAVAKGTVKEPANPPSDQSA